MKQKESTPAYHASTASLLRRMPQLISQAAMPREAETADLLPGMISFVLDELVTEIMQEEQAKGNTAGTRNHAGKYPAPGEQILSTVSRIYNLLPLYADAVSTEEKFHLGKVITKNFEHLEENYSLLDTPVEIKSRPMVPQVPVYV